MVHMSSTIKCLLCQSSLNLSSGDLDKFRHHLETSHEAVHDIDLVISVSFLEGEEKERIVETVFPRIKKFFLDVRSNIGQEEPKLTIQKRLLEDDEIGSISALYRDQKRRKLDDSSKYDSLSEQSSVSTVAGAQVTFDKASDLSTRRSADVDDTKFAYCSVCQLSMPNTKYIEHIKTYHDSSSSNISQPERSVSPAAEESSKSPDKFVNPHESKCDICDKPMLKKSIKKHKQRVHQIYENFKPFGQDGDVSSMDTTTDLNLTDVSIDTSVMEPQVEIEENVNIMLTVPCEVCHKQITKKNMSRHMNTVHNKNGPSNETLDDDRDNALEIDLPNTTTDNKCKICFARFEELDELKEHFKDVHDIEYDSLENSEEDDMTSSLSITKQEKMEPNEFPCDQCDAKYTIKDSLRRHKRNKH